MEPVGRAAAPWWLLPAARVLALGLATLHAAVAMSRQSMNEDGVNYLDMGAAYIAGDWQTAVNAIWSPLYAWVVGLVVHVVEPSIWWEFPVVQMTNVVIFAVALVCFEFFWRELTARYYGGPDGVRFDPAVWLAIGYSLFIWSSLTLIAIWAVTPDMLVAAFVYLAGGLLLRAGRLEHPRAACAGLGAVLGVGYMAKAALFPLGVLCVLLAAAMTTAIRRPVHRLAWSAVPFALAAGPFLGVLSASSGQVTFGDVGRFTYIKHVNDLRYPHWGDSLDNVAGAPLHAPRRIFQAPDVYEFAAPIGGTYPLSFNPGYWTQGLSPRMDAGQQLRALASNAASYFDLFVRVQGGVLAVVLVLVVVAVSAGAGPRRFSVDVALVLWALGAFAMYALVYVEGRYIAPFVVLFWAGVLTWVRFPDRDAYRRLTTAGGAILVLFVWVNIGSVNLEGLTAVLGVSPRPQAASADGGRFAGGAGDSPPDVAAGLLQHGLRPGDGIAVVGDSFTAFWARLARLRIVAEVDPAHNRDFWTAGSARRDDVLNALAGTGAAAVVGDLPVDEPAPAGWQRVGETGYVIRFLR